MANLRPLRIPGEPVLRGALTLADSEIDFLKEGAGQDAREHQGIASDRVAHGGRALATDGGLQPALGGGKNRPRKAGQERLFGHTL